MNDGLPYNAPKNFYTLTGMERVKKSVFILLFHILVIVVLADSDEAFYFYLFFYFLYRFPLYQFF
jgi:hypothetical protein